MAILSDKEICQLPAGEPKNAAYSKKYWSQDRKTAHWHRDSLSSRINCGMGLHLDEIAELTRLLGACCGHKTLDTLAAVLCAVPRVKNFPLYDRVMLYPYDGLKAAFSAGQSYPKEIKMVRNALLGRAKP